MDRLPESQWQYQPRGWQASVLAEQGRRRRWLENSAWMTGDAAVTLFLGVLGFALVVLACVLLMVWTLSLRQRGTIKAPAGDRGATQVTTAEATSDATGPLQSGATAATAATTGAALAGAPNESTLREMSETTTHITAASGATGKRLATRERTTTTTDLASIRDVPAPAAEDCCESVLTLLEDTTIACTRTTNEVVEAADIRHRVRGARQTLSSIHAELPDGLTPVEKYTMTNMMLEAIKANEACKTTSSMQRMEQIAEHGNEIQSELRTIKEEKQTREEIARRSLALRRTMLDGLCVGVLSMVCTVAAVVWYAGGDGRLLPGISVGVFKLRTTRTVAAATCSRGSIWPSTTLPMGLGLRHVLPVLMPLAQLWCHAAHAVRLVQAAALVVLTPILISKLGIFQLGDGVPVFKLIASCGLACGASGWYAVDWLGGHAGVWLVLWEAVVAFTIAVIVSAPRIASRGYRFSKTDWPLLVGMTGFGWLTGFAPFVQIKKT